MTNPTQQAQPVQPEVIAVGEEHLMTAEIEDERTGKKSFILFPVSIMKITTTTSGITVLTLATSKSDNWPVLLDEFRQRRFSTEGATEHQSIQL